ncbi:DoxX family membrane protein [Corynebacterium epidermidicanis]|uniref:Putative membrane protein n=1 Tax=Corynebacterium epidermidicanis TaxID=1050174 RepID=A0A0G3GVQ2_9CORY|nr:DoxX family membrane protein [Corynebacterium epidermidicanis]AKK02947.1 putative membrane protein [Corynebacterium epidermidicanis]
MNNPNKPDRANADSLDGLSDVPTYNSASGQTSNVYQRAGRSAPQSIEPQSQHPETSRLFEVREETVSLPKEPAQAEPTVTDMPAQQIMPEPTYTSPVAAAPVVPTTATSEYEEEVEKPLDHRRGTMDFGLFIIRLVAGLVLLWSGVRTFFELGGAPGLNGLKAEFGDYALPDLLSIAVPSMQLAAGVFLLLGLLTPVAAALATVVTAFNMLHAVAQQDNFSVTNANDSVILALVMLALALGLQFTGPGRVSLDVNRSWARRPLASSWILAILGIAGAVALWWFGAGVNPLS